MHMASVRHAKRGVCEASIPPLSPADAPRVNISCTSRRRLERGEHREHHVPLQMKEHTRFVAAATNRGIQDWSIQAASGPAKIRKANVMNVANEGFSPQPELIENGASRV